MSWQLGALAILGFGLIAGFLWYERTRPDARIVALVGTLAAFAALGRIAFAAVPNVKPTSDIVLISGFALGGAPGYVVGAVAGLTSNFFFGQGPWTPWQMAGWGLTGIAGALLARLTRRRIARLPLACVSFLAGFAFTAGQDAGNWLMYSDHSLGQLGIYVGQGLGFDLVYAGGCFGFAMLFGPALIRTLQRFRTRIEITWLPPRASTGAALCALLVAGLVGGTGASRAAAAAGHGSPVAYLRSAQNPDGGFGSARGQSSDAMDSAWATLALRDAGVRCATAIRYVIRSQRPSDREPGDLERTLLAVGHAGGTSALRARLRSLIGHDSEVGGETSLTAFAILAMRAEGMRVPTRMYAWLAAQQDADGGFNYATRAGQSDVDDTGAALAALTGRRRTATVGRAVAFIRAQQNHDGGFGMQAGDPSNAQSTAFAVSGLIAAGIDPARVHRAGSPSPLAYLRSLIQPDGAVDYARGNSQTPVWVTAQAEIALSNHTL